MTLNTIHHIAIICSDKDAALHFYHDLLGFPIIRSNYREGRKDWKIDLAINDDTELELFIMADRPARVTNPEAYGLRHLAFKVPSVVDTVAELEAKGIECEPVRLDAYTNKPIPAGDEPLKSALRELKEELGLTASEEDLQYAGTFRIQYEKEFHRRMFRDNEVTRVYVYDKPVDIQDLSLQETEVSEVCWFDLEEVWNEIHQSRERFCVPTAGLKVLREYLKGSELK